MALTRAEMLIAAEAADAYPQGHGLEWSVELPGGEFRW